jgi:long-chain fatty acid transport protein
MSDRLSLGISAHNYFGLALDWRDDWIGRGSSVNVTLIAPQLQPAAAYRVNDWLSVGAGAALTLGYMKDKLRIQDPFNPGGSDGKLRLSDTDFAVQGNFGVMLEPTRDMRIGIRYLTETNLDFKDSPDVSGVQFPDLPGINRPGDKLDLRVKMPQAVDVAIHYQWNDKLALLGSVGWEEFSEFGKVQVGIDDTGINTTLDADFRDVWTFGVGMEYRYRPDWELTAGFTFNTSMSTDRTRPIVIPLGNMYRYAVGFKHERRDGLTLGGGLTWIWEGNLPIKDTGGINNGRYNNAQIIIPSLYAKWEF